MATALIGDVLANRQRPGCTHPRLVTSYDVLSGQALGEREVRKAWPRGEGLCVACGQRVIAYASPEHFIAGDW